MRIEQTAARQGQAMVEFIVGLVAVLALAAGILQLSSLTRADTGTMVAARAAAGETAMLDVNVLENPDYIRDWNEGADGRRYSRDDRFTAGDVSGFNSFVVDRAGSDAAEWALLRNVPDDALPALRDEPAPASYFGMVSGDATTNIPLMSAVQSLLYRANSIDVESKVWMTQMRGIY